MNVEQARQLCINAHKDQWRRPTKGLDDKTYWDKGVHEWLSGFDNAKLDNSTILAGIQIHWHSSSRSITIQQPYHIHPFAVADMLSTDEEKVLGYLHDVIEDTSATLESKPERGVYWINLRNEQYFIAFSTFACLGLLTKQPGQTYSEYIDKISLDLMATKVKLADIYHNLSCNPSNRQRDKYMKAIPVLLAAI